MDLKHPKTREIVELALSGLKINEISHKLEVAYTTVADIVRRYTTVKRILIKDLPDDQYSLKL